MSGEYQQHCAIKLSCAVMCRALLVLSLVPKLCPVQPADKNINLPSDLFFSLCSKHVSVDRCNFVRIIVKMHCRVGDLLLITVIM